MLVQLCFIVYISLEHGLAKLKTNMWTEEMESVSRANNPCTMDFSGSENPTYKNGEEHVCVLVLIHRQEKVNENC